MKGLVKITKLVASLLVTLAGLMYTIYVLISNVCKMWKTFVKELLNFRVTSLIVSIIVI